MNAPIARRRRPSRGVATTLRKSNGVSQLVGAVVGARKRRHPRCETCPPNRINAIRDDRVREIVDEELKQGLLWPEPRIGLNPSFAEGAWIDDIVGQQLLHPECSQIFRIKPDASGTGSPLRLHKHQLDAVVAARVGRNYVLTTGTGSGKSLAYIVPIVDHVLRGARRMGIKAIIVYPMNALANIQ
jgi:ATP-dependent helicase YprA (DUF1998 family)